MPVTPLFSASKPLLFLVSSAQAGRRLDKVLSAHPALADFSRARLQQLISDRHILVDDLPRKAGFRLKGGEQITIVLPAVQQVALEAEQIDFDFLFQDEHIAVVDKPAGLVVHPGPGHEQGTLVHGLLESCHDLSGIGGELRPGIVHRLDRDTSGVLVVAKSDQAHVRLAQQFQQRQVDKLYYAVVVGQPPEQQGQLQTLLGRHPIQRKRMAVLRQGGRTAITEYRLLDRDDDLSLLELKILTGRTHQIRVHMAHLGCPVLADPLYGGKRTKLFAAPRLCLHASQLTINHPVTDERMSFLAPLPVDMAKVLTERSLLVP